MPFLNDFLVTTKKSVISENNKQQGARKMSDSGKLVKQNNRDNIDTTTQLMSCHFFCQSSPSRYYYPIKESQDTCSHTNMNAQIYTRPSMLSALNSYRDNRKNATDLADCCSFWGFSL